MPSFTPYRFHRKSLDAMQASAETFFHALNARRSIREFSADTVPQSLIETAIRTASTAPSGAHRQPWKFVAISNQDIKHQIRIAAEQEEFASYEGGRMPDGWRAALEPIGTSWQKPFLETAPWIVVVFEETHRISTEGSPEKNYYVKESVGMACGLFIAALHQMGLATLTHTPSPMGFLTEILERPKNERPFVLFPIGYPAPGARVPALTRKPLADISCWLT